MQLHRGLRDRRHRDGARGPRRRGDQSGSAGRDPRNQERRGRRDRNVRDDPHGCLPARGGVDRRAPRGGLSRLRRTRRAGRHHVGRVAAGCSQVSCTAEGERHRHVDLGMHALPVALRAAPAGARPRRGAGVVRGGDGEGRLCRAPSDRTSPRGAGAPAPRVPHDGRRRAVPRPCGVLPGTRARPCEGRTHRSRRSLVRLSVLGSHGTWPGTGGECSGYLVTSGSFHLWLDAGTGTFARLQEHVAPGDIDAVLITHGHADHFLDVIPAFYARHYGDLGQAGLPFYSPAGFMDLAALLVSENGRNVMAEAYAFDQMEAGRVVEVGPFRVTSFEMTHIGVYSLGYRIQAEGHTLAYTGDTGPCEEAIELARGADLFLCEATYQDPMDHTFFHLSAEQAAEHAARADVRRLVLTHLTPALDPGVSLEQAAGLFAGPIDVATRDAVWEVGR